MKKKTDQKEEERNKGNTMTAATFADVNRKSVLKLSDLCCSAILSVMLVFYCKHCTALFTVLCTVEYVALCTLVCLHCGVWTPLWSVEWVAV